MIGGHSPDRRTIPGQASVTARDGDAGATLADMIGERLRNDIISGHLKPNQRLLLQQMQDAYDVGSTPLREALFKLGAEGLVVTTSRRGFKVAPISLAELDEITRLRQVLERMAIMDSVAAGDDAWEAQIIFAFHRLSKLQSAGNEDWQFWHRAFHDALVAACNSPILQKIRQDLFDRAMRYRRLSGRLSFEWRTHLDEHGAIMDACLARDGEKAATLLSEHFALTRQILLDAIASGEASGFFGDADDSE